MKLPVRCSTHARGLRLKAKGGFALVEVMVGVGVMGIMFVSLYAGFAFGFTQIQLSRENDRAYVTNARVIQVTWSCSRKILGIKATTETVQSAQVVMRNH